MGIGSLGGAALGVAGSLFGGKGESASFNPMNITTGFGSVKNVDGGLTTSLDPRFQGLSDQLEGVSSGLFGQLQGDPRIAANDLFAQAMGMAAPEQARARASNDAKLFARGQLGSTGGGLQTQGLEQGIFNSNNQLAMQSIFDAQSLQDQMFGRGMVALQGMQSIEQMPLGLLQASMQGGAGRFQADSAAAQQANSRRAGIGSMISDFGGGLFRGSGGFGSFFGGSGVSGAITGSNALPISGGGSIDFGTPTIQY